MLDAVQGTYINSLPVSLSAHQHPSSVEAIEKLAPAPTEDPHLYYLDDGKLLGLLLATEVRVGGSFSLRALISPIFSTILLMPLCLASGKMENISAGSGGSC